MDNKMTLTFKAISRNEAFARSVVAAFCTSLNPTLEEINDIKTAVSEAVTNCIVHAYSHDESREITIQAELLGNKVHIKVIDDGVGIADIQRAMQPFWTSKPNEERSGIGFTIMEGFMNGLKVSHNAASGITVDMIKFIGKVD